MDKKSILFPYSEIRKIQDDLVETFLDVIYNKNHLVVHAPTGLGKTAATLPAALAHALKNELTVFFLTSRHTQHKIAIDTLKDIKEKYGTEFTAVDIIGKKWMCSVPGAEVLSSGEFSEFCKGHRENETCEFYTNTRSGVKLTPKAKHVFKELNDHGILDSEKIVQISAYEKLCPYEMSIALSEKASVVVADYFYIFSERIRNNYFKRTDKELGSCIIIVDEGHNLPNRVRDLMSINMTDFILERAIKEAKKYEYLEVENYLKAIYDIIKNYERSLAGKDEFFVDRDEFVKKIELICEYDKLVVNLHFIASDVMENQKRSFIFSIATFLEMWPKTGKEYARFFSRKRGKSRHILSLNAICLDPSMVTRSVIEKSYSTILMSGTLNPTDMYRNLLGFPRNTVEKILESPFPDDNKLSMIVPYTTTKYTLRSPEMYKKIAEACAKMTDSIPGNSAIFFPSYYLRDMVYEYFFNMSNKICFREESGLSKLEKLEMLDRFKACKDKGAVLLGVASGSYGEGVDLPGDLLKCVIVVGLPLQKPDLETSELIKYYDNLFNKGWDYGYLFPAFNKTLQSAGRCIRSENDRGVVVFLDERYAWRNYFRCFPKDYGVKVEHDYISKICDFFSKGI